jgi:hypothetical protein
MKAHWNRFLFLSFVAFAFAGWFGCSPAKPRDTALINLIEKPVKGYKQPPERDHDGFLDDDLNVVYYKKNQTIVWARKFTGRLGGVRPPHILSDQSRVYVSHNNGILALNKPDGDFLWYQEGPNERMALNGNVLYAVSRGHGNKGEKNGWWLFARDTKSGNLAFKYELSQDDDYDPDPVKVFDDVVVVQKSYSFEGGDTKFIDGKGKLLHQLPFEVVDMATNNGRYYVLSGSKVLGYGKDWKPFGIWSFPQAEFLPRGRLFFLNGNTALAYLFCPISDSGVQLMKFDTTTGRTIWNYQCRPLGVGHSAYSHRVTVEIVDANIRVTSDGFRRFVETITIENGNRLDRYYETISFP